MPAYIKKNIQCFRLLQLHYFIHNLVFFSLSMFPACLYNQAGGKLPTFGSINVFRCRNVVVVQRSLMKWNFIGNGTLKWCWLKTSVRYLRFDCTCKTTLSVSIFHTESFIFAFAFYICSLSTLKFTPFPPNRYLPLIPQNKTVFMTRNMNVSLYDETLSSFSFFARSFKVVLFEPILVQMRKSF